MSYLSQAQLSDDDVFRRRSRAAAQQQADIYLNDARPNFIALSQAVLRDEAGPVSSFTRLNAAGPDIAEKVDNGDGTIDQAKVTDEDLLSLTQANWPVVAGLYYDASGAPLP
jgi:hypothetical protein